MVTWCQQFFRTRRAFPAKDLLDLCTHAIHTSLLSIPEDVVVFCPCLPCLAFPSAFMSVFLLTSPQTHKVVVTLYQPPSLGLLLGSSWLLPSRTLSVCGGQGQALQLSLSSSLALWSIHLKAELSVVDVPPA